MEKYEETKVTRKHQNEKNEQNNDEHFWILTPSSSRGDGSIDVFIDEPSFKGGAKKEKKVTPSPLSPIMLMWILPNHNIMGTPISGKLAAHTIPIRLKGFWRDCTLRTQSDLGHSQHAI